MTSRTELEPARRAITRDRVSVVVGLVAIVVAAWCYLAFVAPSSMQGTMAMSGSMNSMSGSMNSISAAPPWSLGTYLIALAMWVAMMIAMMVPSAAPMVLIYASIARKARRQSTPIPRTAVFVGGYILVWSLFSVLAAGLQGLLSHESLLSSAMSSSSSVLAAVLVLSAGLYQLTPAKNACLENCRSPAHFISRHWRQGPGGTFQMGVVHGAYCLGCCWILMALLFVGGVMNLLWVAALAAFVLLEKVIPFGVIGGRLAGAGMAVVGVLGLTGVVTLT